MHALFEVHLVKGADPSRLLSPETLKETQSQIFSTEEAEKIGLKGLPAQKEGDLVRWIICLRRDSPWIHRALESNEIVGGFKVHEIDL